MGRGGGRWAQGTRTPAFEPPDSLSSGASMAPCAASCASASSGLFGTLGCRSRTRIDLILRGSLETKTPLLHPDPGFQQVGVYACYYSRFPSGHCSIADQKELRKKKNHLTFGVCFLPPNLSGVFDSRV